MVLPLNLLTLSSLPHLLSPPHNNITFLSPHHHKNFLPSLPSLKIQSKSSYATITTNHFRLSYRSYNNEDHEDDYTQQVCFDEAVVLFNKREYYKCHDYLEALWNESQEPTRTIVHGILQCAVGFHHLFNQNHKGAMMELGEGLCKLRKMNFESGPFNEFEQEISAALEFIYQTQIELAACSDDYCLTMEQSEKSYKLLGGYAAGQHLYKLHGDSDGITYVVFCPQRSYNNSTHDLLKVKLPMLNANEEHLLAFER